jgi:hypothetical protein
MAANASQASKARLIFLDFVERAGWSAAQVFFATLLAGGAGSTVVGLPWKYAGVLAASAAVSSIILTALQYVARLTNVSFWWDVLIRLVKTFLSSLAASIAASSVFDVTTFHWSNALNVATVATITALGKGLLARGDAGTVRPSPATVSADQRPKAADGTTAIPASRQPADDLVGRMSPSTLPAATYFGAIER